MHMKAFLESIIFLKSLHERKFTHFSSYVLHAKNIRSFPFHLLFISEIIEISNWLSFTFMSFTNPFILNTVYEMINIAFMCNLKHNKKDKILLNVLAPFFFFFPSYFFLDIRSALYMHNITILLNTCLYETMI